MDVLTYLDHPPMLQMYVPVLVLIDRNGMIRNQYLGDDPFQVDAGVVVARKRICARPSSLC
jgi:hypothetical protein